MINLKKLNSLISQVFEKCNQFIDHHLTKILVYDLILLLIIIFLFTNNLKINLNDSENIISLLIQSQSAIIAIVISLSLVASQLASQSYSVRAIDIFKKDKVFLSVLSLYIISISYGLLLYVLISFNVKVGTYLIFIDFLLGFITFVALIPFIFITLNLLTPPNIIQTLNKNINQKNLLNLALLMDTTNISIENYSNMDFLNSFESRLVKPVISQDEPLQTITEIIHNSIAKNDFETSKYALLSIKHKLNSIIEHSNSSDKKKILMLINTYHERIGIVAIDNKNEEIIDELSKILTKNLKDALEDNLYDVVFVILMTFYRLIQNSIKQDLEYSSNILLMATSRVKNELDDKSGPEIIIIKDLLLDSYLKIALLGILERFEDLSIMSMIQIFKVGCPDNLEKIVQYIGDIGIALSEEKMSFGGAYSLFIFSKIMEINEDSHLLIRISKYTYDIGTVFLDQKKYLYGNSSVNKLTEIGKQAISMLEPEAYIISEQIREICKKAILNKDTDVAIFSIPAIKELNEFALDKAFDIDEIVPKVKKISGSGNTINSSNELVNGLSKIEAYGSTCLINKLFHQMISVAEATASNKMRDLSEFSIDSIIEISEKGKKINNPIFVINELANLCEKTLEIESPENSKKIIDYMMKLIIESMDDRKISKCEFNLISKITLKAIKAGKVYAYSLILEKFEIIIKSDNYNELLLSNTIILIGDELYNHELEEELIKTLKFAIDIFEKSIKKINPKAITKKEYDNIFVSIKILLVFIDNIHKKAKKNEEELILDYLKKILKNLLMVSYVEGNREIIDMVESMVIDSR